jgi:hypothetical protein
MKGGSTTINRMGDVLFALREAKRKGLHPTKIQLQKFVYLVDVLSHLVGYFKPREGHKTYKRGPYDQAIQNAVDCLAFRGFVKISGVWETPSGDLAARYAISDNGHLLLTAISQQPAFRDKSRLVELVGNQVAKFGWNRIVPLVYAEPTYVGVGPSKWGIQLRPENGLEVSSSLLISVMRQVVRSLREGLEPGDEWLVERFFEFLNDYDLHYGRSSDTQL